MEYIYPAKFEKEKDGKYSVSFPDIEGAYTCGDNLQEAYDMAEDCLGGVLLGMQEDKKQFPTASSLAKFEVNTDNNFVSLIRINLTEYEKRISNKPIKKSVYLPKDLNDRAELAGINFSQVLRNALAKELQSIENK